MKIMLEIWKDIEEFKGCYQVSNLGNVRSLDRSIVITNHKGTWIQHYKGDIMKQRTDRYGYKTVMLYADGQRKNCKIHRLVAIAFLSNPENKSTVNHKNGDKQNNAVDNLEWNTSAEQNIHAYKVGLKLIHCKPVLQIDIETEEVMQEYPSIREAERQMKVSQGTISDCLNGKQKTCSGFYWKYKNVA